jgi:hypothetical protein
MRPLSEQTILITGASDGLDSALEKTKHLRVSAVGPPMRGRMKVKGLATNFRVDWGGRLVGEGFRRGVGRRLRGSIRSVLM